MTYDEAMRASMALRDLGMDAAADIMEERADQARKQHFQDMQKLCHDDPDFADRYEQDRREGF